MSLMSGKEMRFQVQPKTFRLDGWITRRIGETENAGVEKVIRLQSLGWKMQEWEIGSRYQGAV